MLADTNAAARLRGRVALALGAIALLATGCVLVATAAEPETTALTPAVRRPTQTALARDRRKRRKLRTHHADGPPAFGMSVAIGADEAAGTRGADGQLPTRAKKPRRRSTDAWPRFI